MADIDMTSARVKTISRVVQPNLDEITTARTIPGAAAVVPLVSERIVSLIEGAPGGGIPVDQIVSAVLDAVKSLGMTVAADEVVATVLAGYAQVDTGDAAGTVRSSGRGDVAVRVVIDGIPQWSVTSPNGGHHFDMQPLTDWELKIGAQ